MYHFYIMLWYWYADGNLGWNPGPVEVHGFLPFTSMSQEFTWFPGPFGSYLFSEQFWTQMFKKIFPTVKCSLFKQQINTENRMLMKKLRLCNGTRTTIHFEKLFRYFTMERVCSVDCTRQSYLYNEGRQICCIYNLYVHNKFEDTRPWSATFEY